MTELSFHRNKEESPRTITACGLRAGPHLESHQRFSVQSWQCAIELMWGCEGALRPAVNPAMMKEYRPGGSARAELTRIEAPAALSFSRSIDLFPPHFHSGADDVGFAKGNILDAEKRRVIFQTSDPPNV